MEGEVLVQSYTPTSPSIQFARHHDFEGFVEQEMEFRERFHFPPFSRMVLVTVRSEAGKRPSSPPRPSCADSARSPRRTSPSAKPPPPPEKAKGYYRFQTALRGTSTRAMSRAVQTVLHALPLPDDVFIVADVDPVQLM